MSPKLDIAVVLPRECPLADDLAAGLAGRGHRVRLYRPDHGYERVFRRLRADAPDVISQHVGDPEALALADGLPVLHTLHLSPSQPLVDAATGVRAWFAAPFAFLAAQWRAAGIERIHTIAPGLASCAVPPAVVRPLALVCDRSGALAALRAGIGITMLATLAGTRSDLCRRLAHSAVCVAACDETVGAHWIAAQAQLVGCPVVGYSTGPLPEIVEDGVSGLLVAPGDEPSLAAAVRRAAALDRRAVRQSARARLSLEPMLARYESELRAVARRSVVRLVA